MYQHHLDSIQRMKEYFQNMDGVIALILGGSVAKGNERPDSDLDGLVVLTDEEYEKKVAQGITSQSIFGHCTYPEGYFDVKYMNKDYVRAAAQRGSEPTRNSFIKAQVLFSSDPEITELVPQIGVFQKGEREEKMISFYGQMMLSYNYFLKACKAEGYNRFHAIHEIVYSVYRMILQENEILFPCNRRLEETVEKAPLKPENITNLGRAAAQKQDDASVDAFVQAYLNWTKWPFPEDLSGPYARWVMDFEQWWYRPRPLVTEW